MLSQAYNLVNRLSLIVHNKITKAMSICLNTVVVKNLTDHFPAMRRHDKMGYAPFTKPPAAVS